MYQQNKQYIWIIGGIILSLLVILGIWFLFSRSSTSTQNTNVSTSFGTATTNTTTGSNTPTSNGSQPINEGQTSGSQKIFQISQGPIAGATLMQTLHPTTTLARYIKQEDGHVYDLPLDVPGAVPRVVSNVTIPGAARVVWLERGNAALLQYLDGTVVKSVYLGLPLATTSTKMVATRIQFLPDNIIDLAASPDGASVVYMLKTSSGSDGYISRSDGTGAKKVFSLPLSQVLITWPAPGTLLAQSKSAAGVPGVAFSVDVKNGAAKTLLYAQGLTAIADKTFTNIVYQTIQDTAQIQTTFLHNIKSGGESSLSFNPFPEKCIWSNIATTTMLCAAPLNYTTPSYLDGWRLGTESAADAIIFFNLTRGLAKSIANPGSDDGGVKSDILEMALSPDEHYLSFTIKGARALWGVRLTQ